MKTIRIGSGAGYGGDRLDPALALMKHGELDYIGFECLAERTIALAQKRKLADPQKGYNNLLESRMEKVLPLAYKKDIKVITNMGAANSEAALKLVERIAIQNGLKGMKIASVVGDDISDRVNNYYDLPTIETKALLRSFSDQIISANAYLGYQPILEALEADADIVITGRVVDPALYLAPLVYEFGWSSKNYGKLGKGTLVGHLLECAGQLTGGYFADPGKKEVPELWNLGFPYIDVDETGDGIISKLEGTGGEINPATCTEQMLYEIHNPAGYITPDCVANFSDVIFDQIEKDRVAFKGATGSQATDSYKVSVGYRNGFIAVGEISYGGPNCVARARLASQIVKKRIEYLGIDVDDLRCTLIGINSISPFEKEYSENALNKEVRLHVAGRTRRKQEAQKIVNEVQSLYTNGPAGGGGATKSIDEMISVVSFLVPKTDIQTKFTITEVN